MKAARTASAAAARADGNATAGTKASPKVGLQGVRSAVRSAAPATRAACSSRSATAARPKARTAQGRGPASWRRTAATPRGAATATARSAAAIPSSQPGASRSGSPASRNPSAAASPPSAAPTVAPASRLSVKTASRYHVGVNPERPEDRREHARTAVELQVAYEKLNAFFADYTKNISKGGTFIPTRRT